MKELIPVILVYSLMLWGFVAASKAFIEEGNRWEVSFLNTFQDAQSNFYGFPNGSFLETKVIIHLNQT